ncbi:MAG: PAS domain S-box protein, partial [Deltaproteobacteria bacterium]
MALMTDDRLKILLIEDNPADALLVKEMLAQTRSFSCELTHVDRFEKCGMLPDRERVDIVLLDLTLPDVQGLETVVKTCDIMAGKPIVVMSGIEDEDLAIKALQEGAQDYLVKGQVDSDLLARSIRYAMERKLSEDSLWKAYTELERRVQERTAELVEANRVIRESEKKYRMLVEQASDGIFILDEDACIRDVNSTACKMLGYLPEELLQLNIRDIIPDEDLSEVPLRHREVLAGEKVVIERRFRRKNGTFISVEVSAARLEDGRLQTIVRDLTERKKAEEAIRRSEASLAEAQRIAHIGNWDWDIQNN